MSEHDEHELDKYTIRIPSPTPEEQHEREQQMFRRARLRDTITALQENPALARAFWRALIAVLPEARGGEVDPRLIFKALLAEDESEDE